MRVIAGRFRGLTVDAPPGMQTRPMTDRVRESVFNILGARLATPGTLPECAVLDLFSGSGALGIEALSRGAAHCLFVERDRRSLRVLRANVDRLKQPDQTRIASENIWTLRIPRPPQGFAGYGLIFADPPFKDVEATVQVAALLGRTLRRLLPGGVLVFRHDSVTHFDPTRVRGARVVDDRSFGRNRFVFFAAEPAAPADQAALINQEAPASSAPSQSAAAPAADQQPEEEDRPERVRHDADGELEQGDTSREAVTDAQERCARDQRADQ